MFYLLHFNDWIDYLYYSPLLLAIPMLVASNDNFGIVINKCPVVWERFDVASVSRTSSCSPNWNIFPLIVTRTYFGSTSTSTKEVSRYLHNSRLSIDTSTGKYLFLDVICLLTWVHANPTHIYHSNHQNETQFWAHSSCTLARSQQTVVVVASLFSLQHLCIDFFDADLPFQREFPDNVHWSSSKICQTKGI